MAIFNCKMCGGSLEINQEMSTCKCEYCGLEQTLPKSDDERFLSMLNRANHFRQVCEFDKAMELYERILNSSENVAEVYWSIALCRYGIEYVEDPRTGKKIPTCHRTQYKSILQDSDYLSALEYADAFQASLFREEAAYIDTIQKGILEISNKEKPFDVFICYKESDDYGERTKDSVLAQEIYYRLTEDGYKVFFSRITLEDKLGTKYEPYIFAALNSARVMVVVGTKPEYFNAVWVKNEWGRFLDLMQNDKHKMIIPAYRDMDPYDLPDALSYFQAQDMSKIGFLQDLTRGIVKILGDGRTVQAPVKETVHATAGASVNSDALTKRGYMALEDGDWTLAKQYFEQILNQNAESAEAYLGIAFAQNECADLDGFIRKRLDASAALVPEECENCALELSQEEKNSVLSQIDINRASEELKQCLDVILNWKDTYLKSDRFRAGQLEKERAYLEQDRYFKRAVQFAPGKLASDLEACKNTILTEMEKRAAQSGEEDERGIAEGKNRIYTKISNSMELTVEKQRLTEEVNELRKRISNLESGKTEVNTQDNDRISEEIRRLLDQQEKLGFWQKKEKEAMQHQIEYLRYERDRINERSRKEWDEKREVIKQEIEELCSRLKETRRNYYLVNNKLDWVISGHDIDDYTPGTFSEESFLDTMERCKNVAEMAARLEEMLEATPDNRLLEAKKTIDDYVTMEKWYGNMKKDAMNAIMKRL